MKLVGETANFRDNSTQLFLNILFFVRQTSKLSLQANIFGLQLLQYRLELVQFLVRISHVIRGRQGFGGSRRSRRR